MSTYNTTTMLAVMKKLHAPSNFWLNLAFNEQINFDTAEIFFDKIKGGRRIAPYVAPTAQGKVMKELGSEVKFLSPAYLKPKNIVDPARVLTRQPGEELGGSKTPVARQNAIKADIMREQKDMIMRRWELMAFEAIATGKVTVKGEDYPEQVVDFGRDPSQEVTLAGTDLWSDSASKPYEDLENWSVQTQRLCGYAIKDWILGANAWKALIRHADTKELLDRNSANGNHNLQAGPGNIPDDGAIVEFKGTVGAGIRIWTYQDIYEDDNGQIVEVMDADAVIGISPKGVQGVRCFGAILDAEAGYASLSMFPKNWINPDPSVEYIMTQSAPLMVPREPNATFTASVV